MKKKECYQNESILASIHFYFWRCSQLTQWITNCQWQLVSVKTESVHHSRSYGIKELSIKFSVILLLEKHHQCLFGIYYRKEYVDLCVNYIFNKSVKKPFEDFMQGFLRGCPARNWKMFFPEELQVLLQGCTTFDWHLLEKVLYTSTVSFCSVW